MTRGLSSAITTELQNQNIKHWRKQNTRNRAKIKKQEEAARYKNTPNWTPSNK